MPDKTNAKSSAHYQRLYRKRLREQGLVKKEVWIRPEFSGQLTRTEKQLRHLHGAQLQQGGSAVEDAWTTQRLYQALSNTQLFTSGKATLELIDGIEPSLHIVMHEFGDLPLFLSVAGEQILVDALLWSANDVVDQQQFEQAVLRSHKYFPLSTISLDHMPDQGDYYNMFGALSAKSVLPNIVFEIEMLASNVIQAATAYADYLTLKVEV